MSAPPDSRYAQKMLNFAKAAHALERSASSPITEPRDMSGIVKDFEIVYELSWKLLKAFLEKEGHETGSAKDVFSRAYQFRYLQDQAVWLEMIADRNLTVHTYDEKLAAALCERIRQRYVPAFQALSITLKAAV